MSSVGKNVAFANRTPSTLGEALRPPTSFSLHPPCVCLQGLHLLSPGMDRQRKYVRDLPSCLQPKRVPLLVPRSSWEMLAVLFSLPGSSALRSGLGKKSEPLDLLRGCAE